MLKPGDPVTITERIKTALADIPPGTLAVVIWADERIAQIQPVGHINQGNVPVTWLRKVRRNGRD